MRTVTLLVLLASLVTAAPVPRHRTKARIPLTAHPWVMVWGEGNVGWRDTVFARDGYYECDGRWTGSWLQKGDHMEVLERSIDRETAYVWSVKLKDGVWEGVLNNGSKFRLLKQE